jgi:hypothetical protein
MVDRVKHWSFQVYLIASILIMSTTDVGCFGVALLALA